MSGWLRHVTPNLLLRENCLRKIHGFWKTKKSICRFFTSLMNTPFSYPFDVLVKNIFERKNLRNIIGFWKWRKTPFFHTQFCHFGAKRQIYFLQIFQLTLYNKRFCKRNCFQKNPWSLKQTKHSNWVEFFLVRKGQIFYFTQELLTPQDFTKRSKIPQKDYCIKSNKSVIWF